MSGVTPAASAPAVREAATPSIVRTVVPVIVGAVVSYLFGIELVAKLLDTFGVDVNEATQGFTLITTAVLTSLYYSIVRVFEVNKPKFGWLLGLAKTPVYVQARDAATALDAEKRDRGAYDPLYILVVVILVILLVWLLMTLF